MEFYTMNPNISLKSIFRVNQFNELMILPSLFPLADNIVIFYINL